MDGAGFRVPFTRQGHRSTPEPPWDRKGAFTPVVRFRVGKSEISGTFRCLESPLSYSSDAEFRSESEREENNVRRLEMAAIETHNGYTARCTAEMLPVVAEIARKRHWETADRAVAPISADFASQDHEPIVGVCS
ncbi:hypothetical protein K0M31_006339 [Melipona bicolor]|uniref:Uncharacterized protein n=1 Tax=Melipona bicolor TaxID=60889 RepID=A0AA40FTU6_9HYME|nr:hypothetical protein K0M31_006339 [Melipona bicolor]